MEGGRTFMATWRKDEERAAEVRRNKREAEEADKTPIALGVTAGQLRRYRAALTGPLPPPAAPLVPRVPTSCRVEGCFAFCLPLTPVPRVITFPLRVALHSEYNVSTCPPV